MSRTHHTAYNGQPVPGAGGHHERSGGYGGSYGNEHRWYDRGTQMRDSGQSVHQVRTESPKIAERYGKAQQYAQEARLGKAEAGSKPVTETVQTDDVARVEARLNEAAMNFFGTGFSTLSPYLQKYVESRMGVSRPIGVGAENPDVVTKRQNTYAQNYFGKDYAELSELRKSLVRSYIREDLSNQS